MHFHWCWQELAHSIGIKMDASCSGSETSSLFDEILAFEREQRERQRRARRLQPEPPAHPPPGWRAPTPKLRARPAADSKRRRVKEEPADDEFDDAAAAGDEEEIAEGEDVDLPEWRMPRMPPRRAAASKMEGDRSRRREVGEAARGEVEEGNREVRRTTRYDDEAEGVAECESGEQNVVQPFYGPRRGTKRRGGVREQERRQQLAATPEVASSLAALFGGQDEITVQDLGLLRRAFGGSALDDMVCKALNSVRGRDRASSSSRRET